MNQQFNTPFECFHQKNVVFFDEEGNELEKCIQSIYVQFVSYIFSQKDVEGDMDVERGEDPKGEAEEEDEGLMDKCLPDCIKQNIPRIMLVLVVAWGLISDTLLLVWDVVSDYILAGKHFR